MEKLKKYNQRLLAIIGTLVLVGMALFAVGVGGALLVELYSWWGDDRDYDNAIKIEETVLGTDTLKLKIRDQAVSFDKPVLIDTTKQIYLISVSQVNLEEPEEVYEEPGALGLMNMSRSKKFRSYGRTGNYNNLILLDGTDNSQWPVFDMRINITKFYNTMIQDRHLLFVYGNYKDTNKDLKLNHQDLSSLFIYDIDAKKLNEVTFEDLSVSDVYTMIDSTRLVIRFQLDKNKDGQINSWKEPSLLKELSLKDFTTKDLIDEQLSKQLQGLID